MSGGANAAQILDVFGVSGTTLEGRFKVGAAIAEGGFGVVYLAHHLGLDVKVALKMLKTPPDISDRARAEFIEKFLAEAKTMARIRHPHIVHVFDTGVSATPSGIRAPWMVLEWLEGVPLDQMLRVRRNLGGVTPAECLALLRPVFEALAYAHDEGIAHRDIKPANVMVVETRRGPVPRLLDFGLAKLMAEGEHAGTGHTKTQSRITGYSPLYAAPEQVGSARTGPWTDVHGLGLIVTEVLTDQPPLPKGDMTETLREALSLVRPTPAKFGIDVGAWEPVIARALAYKPEDRFPDAGSFLAALVEALPGAYHAPLAHGAPTPSASQPRYDSQPRYPSHPHAYPPAPSSYPGHAPQPTPPHAPAYGAQPQQYTLPPQRAQSDGVGGVAPVHGPPPQPQYTIPPHRAQAHGGVGGGAPVNWTVPPNQGTIPPVVSAVAPVSVVPPAGHTTLSSAASTQNVPSLGAAPSSSPRGLVVGLAALGLVAALAGGATIVAARHRSASRASVAHTAAHAPPQGAAVAQTNVGAGAGAELPAVTADAGGAQGAQGAAAGAGEGAAGAGAGAAQPPVAADDAGAAAGHGAEASGGDAGARAQQSGGGAARAGGGEGAAQVRRPQPVARPRPQQGRRPAYTLE